MLDQQIDAIIIFGLYSQVQRVLLDIAIGLSVGPIVAKDGRGDVTEKCHDVAGTGRPAECPSPGHETQCETSVAPGAPLP